MQTRTRGGWRETDVKALAVRPMGRPSLSTVVMMVTPEQKWPRTRRNSSAPITRSLYQFRSLFSSSPALWRAFESSASLTASSAGPYTAEDPAYLRRGDPNAHARHAQ